MAFLPLAAAVILLMPLAVSALNAVPIPRVEIVMKSLSGSDPVKFPVAVLEKTDKFMRLVLNQEYGERFERVSLSLISDGITAVHSGGFVDTLDLKGTVYFKDQMAPSFYDLYKAIDMAFSENIKVYLKILSESTDEFLSSISSVDVEVSPVATQEENNEDEGLSSLMAGAIAVSSAVFSALVLCVVCICCLGDPEDEEVTGVKISETGATARGSGDEDSQPIDDMESTMDASGMLGADPLDFKSITSQDSSKFTYNPRSDLTDGGFTYSTYEREGNNVAGIFDIDEWKKGGIISPPNDGIEVPFGQDISAIGDERCLSNIEEVDSKSVATNENSLFAQATDLLSPQEKSLMTIGGMSETGGVSIAGMSEVGIGLEDDNEPSQSIPSTIRPKHMTNGARVINDDLMELENQVASHRKLQKSERVSPYSGRSAEDSDYDDDQDRHH